MVAGANLARGAERNVGPFGAGRAEPEPKVGEVGRGNEAGGNGDAEADFCLVSDREHFGDFEGPSDLGQVRHQVMGVFGARPSGVVPVEEESPGTQGEAQLQCTFPMVDVPPGPHEHEGQSSSVPGDVHGGPGGSLKTPRGVQGEIVHLGRGAMEWQFEEIQSRVQEGKDPGFGKPGSVGDEDSVGTLALGEGDQGLQVLPQGWLSACEGHLSAHALVQCLSE